MTGFARFLGFFGIVLLVIGIPVGMMLCTFIARDMDRRGLDGRFYGALAFFCFPAGVVVWLVQRSAHPVTEEGL